MRTLFFDWGTTNLRAYLWERDRVTRTHTASTGLREGREIGFAKVVMDVLSHFKLPKETRIRITGMAGSRNGWKEVPYASTPAGAHEIGKNSVRVESFPDLKIVSGLVHESEGGERDVMRGEDVQALGLNAMFPQAEVICLPGTHSKWVVVRDEEIQSFSTWMTGDLFRCVSERSIFQEQISNSAFNEAAFLKGVTAAKTAGHLLNSLFHLRADYLFEKTCSETFHSYLSGFLIGHEVKEAGRGCSEIFLCGSEELMTPYAGAMKRFGISPKKVSAEEATVRGLFKLSEEIT